LQLYIQIFSHVVARQTNARFIIYSCKYSKRKSVFFLISFEQLLETML